MAKRDPKVNVAIKRSSWQNIFDTVRSKDSSISTLGNFWAALQEIERQVTENDEVRTDGDPRAKDRIREGRFDSSESAGICAVCEQPLISPGGYGGTGMCGPCATGEADTLFEE